MCAHNNMLSVCSEMYAPHICVSMYKKAFAIGCLHRNLPKY